jgi:hypothetical protein
VSETVPDEAAEFAGATTLPFVLDRVEGADCLVVGFPGYRTGGAQPSVWLRASLRRLPAHRLLLGSDVDSYLGPGRRCLGLETAAQLIRQTIADLQLPPARVACFGSSMASVLAAITGLRFGAGLVALGAPPVMLGSLLSGWAEQERRPGSNRPVASAARFLEVARTADDDDPVAWLDDLIFRLAADCPRDATLRLLASEHDWTYPGIQRLVEHVGGLPRLRISVETTDIPQHDRIAAAFHSDFLPRVVAEEFGLTLLPDPVS